MARPSLQRRKVLELISQPYYSQQNRTQNNACIAWPAIQFRANNGENYNIGLLDVTGRDYPELVSATQEIVQRRLRVHSGTIPPFSQRRRPPMLERRIRPGKMWRTVTNSTFSRRE